MATSAHKFRSTGHSVIARASEFKTLSESKKNELLYAEMQWHISQHYFAECLGEPILEHLLQHTENKRMRAILTTQLQDEKAHEKAFAELGGIYGLESRARVYADGYSSLVLSQETFAKKIFAFQILTEAVSAAYCEWRLHAFDCARINAADEKIFRDEEKHLAMGQGMLQIEASKVNASSSDVTEWRNLIYKMNDICRASISTGMKVITESFDQFENTFNIPTRLDFLVARRLLREARTVESTYYRTEQLCQ